ncbi:SpoIIIAH-like family protein [Clostridium saccharobutylicum]|uniref:SpoIIIAH-like protein n=1 Tax=Clostridium saccharobutylicum DSM 13864 TaxID=1345695 RepID=U5MW40_CLOSA|nr:SpoIIIAH-like family protein [Clostridium saccharobutylicum]AGX43662.1 SpoIIIAH-like protein [Clostridium saccharobutylicum DSM 13864]AQR90960.1 stage III sporulation protein AH [Clostridium saccharobutylicum]AQS00864.1 stage III sporulation protein AH [Clostridium saccharobutylicum]AQS10520.1 stage III sporulation protein AH [Clostridium saccharobutylicum]AQS14847.1 stage III sporulation protein AH [Clostridium saccharobutylicum]
MTKKQCGIIFTLLALILCVGMLAAKLNNGGLNDPTDLSQVLSTENSNQDSNQNLTDSDKEAMNQQNSFYDSRSSREQQDSATIQTLNSIISDKNTSKDQKDEATKELTKKAMVKDNEGRIELDVKNKGYEDALCMIEDKKVTVVVKSQSPLQESDSVAIQEIVQNVSNIKDVIIETQK